MIDFRYHLVSIVSIFLALAVGIVLGAGPLQQQIGTTLTSEVTQLRKDKAELRAEADALAALNKAQDAFEEESLPRVVSGTLIGRSVTVVSLPGVDQGLVDRTISTLDDGGATVVHRLAITARWVSQDPADVTTRTEAALAGATKLGLTANPTAANPTATTPVSLEQVLATAVFGGAGSTDDAAVGRAVIADLRTAGLLESDDTPAATSTSAVFVSGLVTDGDTRQRAEFATAWLQLPVTFRARSTGTVVVSDLEGAPDDAVTMLGSLRASSTARAAISGVDNGATTIGQASIDFALAGQTVGKVGQYGTQAGVDAPYAPVPPS